MRVFVTGGAGFIGSRLAKRLLDDGHTVLICDNMATGLESNLDARAKTLRMGAESPDLLNELRNFKPDAIAHVGGNSSGEVGELEPMNDAQWNVLSTLNLLTIAQQLKIGKFVYASSMGVYGQSPKDHRLTESDAGNPISVYGTGKLNAERYLSTFAQRGINVVSLRMFNVYGPGQNLANPRQGMLSIYMEQLLRSPKVVVRGSLDRVRDFVFIDDVVDAWLKALSADHLTGHQIVNIGTGVGTSVGQIFDTLRTFAGPIEIDLQSPTPADQNTIISNPSKALEVLAWKANVSLQDGLKSMWTWAKQQKQYAQ